MASNARLCYDSGTTLNIDFNSLPLTIGDICSVSTMNVEKPQPNLCLEITRNVGASSEWLAQNEYNNCYDCLAVNQGVIGLVDCFSERRFDITINGLGFLPEFLSTIYLTVNLPNTNPSEAFTSCFTVGRPKQITVDEYNKLIDAKRIFIPQSSATTQSDCETCLKNNNFPSRITRCTDDAIDYVVVPNGIQGHLISYTDGISQYCGVVGPLESGPTGFTYVSDYGDSKKVKCDVCLDVANDKFIIQSCTKSEIKEVVWASALFQNGDVSNLSTDSGCFEVIGITESATTINEFLNFDPQPGCEPCIECNGINYEYEFCGVLKDFNGGAAINVDENISDLEYSPDTNKIYVSTLSSGQMFILDPTTNSIVGSIGGGLAGINDTEYYDTNILYSLGQNGPGYIHRVNTFSNNYSSFVTNSYNYYAACDSVNDRVFYTCYNSVSGNYEMRKFNTLTNTTTSTHNFGTGSGYYRLSYNPDVNKVYTCSGYYEIAVLNADDLSSVTTITCSGYNYDVEYSPCTKKMYVTSPGNKEIYVIDPNTDTIINTISTPHRPYVLKYNETDKRMYVSTNADIFMVLDTTTNVILLSNSVSAGLQPTRDFTFYPPLNSTYLPFYYPPRPIKPNYISSYIPDYNTGSSYMKSYQYLPVNTTFYNPRLSSCCTILGTASSYYETLYSVEIYDDCNSCATCNGEIWEATGCGLSTYTTFNVRTDGGLSTGDIVKLKWGSNDWICVELQAPHTTSGYYETFYNSKSDASGNTVTYSNCASCESTTYIGLTIVNCDTGVERYVRITNQQYLELNSLEGYTNYVINDFTGCYTISNFCPIPLSATTEYVPVEFFPFCELCSPSPYRTPRSANTENFVCVTCCTCDGTSGSTFSVTPPHPVWIDEYGTPVTQMNMITLGGINGLNG